MKTIIMVRHGQSRTNVDKVFTGQLDAPLTELGRQQAQLMAQYLDKYKVDKIYVSPLQRAVDTAQMIASRQNCPMEKCNGIKEINSGLWQGLTFEEIAEKFPDSYQVWKNNFDCAAPEGGETCAQLYQRVTGFFEKVLQQPENVICLVCHATPIRMMESYIRCANVNAAQEISWVPNASVTVYQYDGTFQMAERGSDAFLGELCTNLPKTI